ncbi:MAG: hypothetical protein ACRCSQ_03905 [Bacteroidales bacterium]
MENKIYITLFFFLSACLYTSCSKEDLTAIQSTSTIPEGKVILSVDYKISQPDQIQTKTGMINRENGINEIFLFLFEAQYEGYQLDYDKLLQVVKGEIVTNETVQEAKFIVSEYQGNCRIKIIANPDPKTRDAILKFPTLENSSEPATVSEFKNLRYNVSSLNNEKETFPFPMTGTINDIIPGINKKTNLRVSLDRICARIDVAVHDTVSNFTLHEIILCNGYKSGRYDPYARGEFPSMSYDSLTTVYKISEDNKTAGPIYLFENQEDRTGGMMPTTVLVKGTFTKDNNRVPGYYNLFIEYKKGSDYFYTINRNQHFNILIHRIRNHGYKTAREAFYSPSENEVVDMDVDITDNTNVSSDITYHSSGYAINTTNSEVAIYGDHPEEYIAATLSFHKKVTTESSFIPIREVNVINNNPDIIITNKAEILNRSLGSNVDLKIRCSHSGVTGAVEIWFGGLRKLIHIKTHPILSAFSQETVLVPNVLNAQYGLYNVYDSWFRINSINIYPDYLIHYINNKKPASVYCKSPYNPGITKRYATPLYLTRKGNAGTLKIIATQSGR